MTGDWRVPPRAIFYGVDWSRDEGYFAVSCPRCSTGHRWRKRMPKWCRECGLEFVYTAADAPKEDQQPQVSGDR
jgi:hypothetical protein